jgi:hypothetical protein
MTKFRSRCRWVPVPAAAIAAALVFSIVQPPPPAGAGTYTTFDFPGSSATLISDISGSSIIGTYSASGKGHGYLYDGSTYTTLDVTGATSTYFVSVYGNRVVGSYADSAGRSHGFLYDGAGQTYTTLDVGTTGTWVNSISGSNVVGQYRDAAGTYHGFLYNGSTYTTLDPVGSTYTMVTGVSGSNVVGYYQKAIGPIGHTHGFLYNGSTYITLDYPGAYSTGADAVYGSTVVGSAWDEGPNYGFLYHYGSYSQFALPGFDISTVPCDMYGDVVVGKYHIYPGGYRHGFVYDARIGTFTMLDVPGADPNRDTYPSAIWDEVAVGDYYDTTTHTTRGFIYTIPEPSAIVLLGIGVAGLMAGVWRGRKRTQ